jgi:hypothetical protein
LVLLEERFVPAVRHSDRSDVRQGREFNRRIEVIELRRRRPRDLLEQLHLVVIVGKRGLAPSQSDLLAPMDLDDPTLALETKVPHARSRHREPLPNRKLDVL